MIDGHARPLSLLPSAARELPCRHPRGAALAALRRGRARGRPAATSTPRGSIPSCRRRGGATTMTRRSTGRARGVRRAADEGRGLRRPVPDLVLRLPGDAEGLFDRLFMPGVGFDISDPAHVKPLLGTSAQVAGISTYGRPRWRRHRHGGPAAQDGEALSALVCRAAAPASTTTRSTT